ncbi:MAG: cysteine-rich CWC family protein [Rubrivivax sp.]
MSGAADSRCPRCGGAFHCGVNDAEPCACTTLPLDDVTLIDLRQRYAGCLCLACLRDVIVTQRTWVPEP